MLIQELSSGLVLDLLFGRTSDFYTAAYNEGIIDESFSYDFTLENGFGFAMVGSDTDQPKQLESAIRKTMQDAVESLADYLSGTGSDAQEENWAIHAFIEFT